MRGGHLSGVRGPWGNGRHPSCVPCVIKLVVRSGQGRWWLGFGGLGRPATSPTGGLEGLARAGPTAAARPCLLAGAERYSGLTPIGSRTAVTAATAAAAVAATTGTAATAISRLVRPTTCLCLDNAAALATAVAACCRQPCLDYSLPVATPPARPRLGPAAAAALVGSRRAQCAAAPAGGRGRATPRRG